MNKKVLPHILRMVAWEVTRSCNLACIHCRASAKHGPYAGELTTDEALRLLDAIAVVSKPCDHSDRRGAAPPSRHI